MAGGAKIADLEDVHRAAMSLPETVVDEHSHAVSVMNRGKPKRIAWVWLERVHPKKARVPNPAVIGVRVRDLEEKEMLLATNPQALFTEPHYRGYPAVLLRLAEVQNDFLEYLVTNAWRCQAPPALVKKLAAE